MQTGIRTIALLLSAALYCCAADLPEVSNGAFSVRVNRTLQVTHKGRVIIEKDEFSYLNSLAGAEEPTVQREGEATAINVIQKDHDAVRFRKEVALHSDGHLELTVRIRLMPYKNMPDKKSIAYSFMVPAAMLDGTAYKARVDRASRAKTLEGAFSAGKADGSLAAAGVRFIAFQSKRRGLVFDCNPYGVMSLQDYCMYGDPIGKWTVAKQGDHVVFSFGYSARFYGGVFTGKLLIYEGAYDYEQRHPYSKWSYREATPAMAQFTFGTAADTEGFEKADCLPFSAKRHWGWENASGLTMVQSDSPAVIDNCVAAPAGTARTFLLDVTPGQYLVTLRVGHSREDIGPFSVSLNGPRPPEQIRVKAGETQTLLLSHYVRSPDSQLKIGFDGPGAWAIRSLVAHAVIYQNQDFTFDRSLWIVPGLFDSDIKLEW